MALMSQGGSYCIQSDLARCKTAHGAVYSFSNNGEGSRIKEVFSGLNFSPLSSSKATTGLHLGGMGKKLKQGNQMIVAASPPTEDAVIAAEPLTKEDLVGYLASGCKPKEKWRFNF